MARMIDQPADEQDEGGAQSTELVDVLIEHAWNTYTGRCDCGWFVPNELRGPAIDVAHASHQAKAVEQVINRRPAALVDDLMESLDVMCCGRGRCYCQGVAGPHCACGRRFADERPGGAA